MIKKITITILIIATLFLAYKIFHKEKQVAIGTFPEVSIADMEKKIKSRDLMGQYQKFYETFKVYETWNKDQQRIYREQHSISEEFITMTRDYFKNSQSSNK